MNDRIDVLNRALLKHGYPKRRGIRAVADAVGYGRDPAAMRAGAAAIRRWRTGKSAVPDRVYNLLLRLLDTEA